MSHVVRLSGITAKATKQAQWLPPLLVAVCLAVQFVTVSTLSVRHKVIAVPTCRHIPKTTTHSAVRGTHDATPSKQQLGNNAYI